MKNTSHRHLAQTSAVRPAKRPFLLILLLSILFVLCWSDPATAAPTPVELSPRRAPRSIVSTLLGGISIGVGSGGTPFRGIHRPYFQGRADIQDVNSSIRKRAVAPIAAAVVDDAPAVRSVKLEKRRKSSSNGYKPGGTGSGGQYDKGQPYGR